MSSSFTSNRSAFVRAPWSFDIRDNPVPPPGAGHLLVEVAACGVCGTDVHMADRAATEWQAFGHEAAGIVREVGEGVTRFTAGDRVALDSSAPCGRCDACLPPPYGRARPDLCLATVSYGSLSARGFSRWLLAPQECAVAVPAGIPLSIACLAEPVGVSIDLVEVTGVGRGDHVLVLGPGPLGLAAAFLSILAGAEKVTLAGRSHSVARLNAGLALGADAVIHTDITPLAGYDFGARRPDKILVTSPPETISEAVAVAARGAAIGYIGVAFGLRNEIRLDADDFHFRKLSLRPSHASPATHAAESLRTLDRHPILGRELVSDHFALEELPAAMRRCRDDRGAIKKLVMVNETAD